MSAGSPEMTVTAADTTFFPSAGRGIKRNKKLWLEVKTTNGSATTPFYITRNECCTFLNSGQMYFGFSGYMISGRGCVHTASHHLWRNTYRLLRPSSGLNTRFRWQPHISSALRSVLESRGAYNSHSACSGHGQGSDADKRCRITLGTSYSSCHLTGILTYLLLNQGADEDSWLIVEPEHDKRRKTRTIRTASYSLVQQPFSVTIRTENKSQATMNCSVIELREDGHMFWNQLTLL